MIKYTLIQMNTDSIIDVINKKPDIIFYAASSVNLKIAKALNNLAKKSSVYFICDHNIDVYYNGLGDFDGIKLLYENQNINFKSSKDFAVSFLITLTGDNLLLFPESRIFKEKSMGFNAVIIDSLLANKIVHSIWDLGDINRFWETSKDYHREMLNDLEDWHSEDRYDLNNLKIKNSKVPDRDEMKLIEIELENNPPQSPDLKRKVNLFNRHIQYVDLKFKGANFDTKKISFPRGALPFKNQELINKIQTKLELFTSIDKTSEYQSFQDLKDSIEQLRSKYLYHSKVKLKSLTKLKDKLALQTEVESIRDRLKEVQRSLIQFVDVEIRKSKSAIEDELLSFLTQNPPEEHKELSDDPNNLEVVLRSEVEAIITRIKFPKPKSITDDMSLSYDFYDITPEDYHSEEFIKELESTDWLSREEFLKLFEREVAFKSK